MSLFGPPDMHKLKAKRDVKGLIKALGYQKDWRIRWSAAPALGRIGDARAVEPLIATLEDQNKDVRTAAALGLGSIGDARAIEPLIRALMNEDESDAVHVAAAEALGRLAWKPDSEAAGAAYWVVKSEWGKCVEIGAPAVEPLIGALKDEVQSAAFAARALGKIGDARAVEPLIGALKGSLPKTRKAAAFALDELAWSPDSGEAGAAYWVVWGRWDKCVEIGAPAVGLLIAFAGRFAGSDADVCTTAIMALGKIGDARAVEPLIHALSNSDRNVHKAAVEALGQIGAPAVEPLIAALTHNMWECIQAAEALGEIGDARAVEPLIVALGDPNTDVRKAAVEALDRLARSPDSGEAGAAYWVVKGEWDKCVQIGAPAVEPLTVALNDKNKNVRKAAAQALVAIYQAGKLDDVQKVLAQRGVITKPHHDYDYSTRYANDCDAPTYHVDEGIGVDFPV